MTFTHAEEATTKQIPQYVATLSVCLGAVATGTVMAWTSNISNDMLLHSFNGIEIDVNALGWIGSFDILGSIFSCIPSAILCNVIGRKHSLLFFTIPFLAGWLFIIFAKWLWMIYVGRFLTGIAALSFFVCGPIYISEISDNATRGRLSSYLDLHMSIGIFLANAVAFAMDMRMYTIVMSVIPVLFAVTFVFQPESPFYYATKNYDEKAKKSICKLRGKFCNVDKELNDIKQNITSNTFSKESIMNCLKKKGTQKAILICFSLKVFQQGVGMDAINAYTGLIFKYASVELDEKLSSVIVVAFQVLATILATIVVDKIGRKILLIVSSLASALGVGALAIYFTLKDREILNEDEISNLAYLPVIALSIYAIAISLGVAPMTIVLTAELFPEEIKSIGLGLSTLLNLLIAFLLTKYYFNIEDSIGTDGTFYIFTAVCLLTAIFTYFFIPETKGKTFAEIQMILNN